MRTFKKLLSLALSISLITSPLIAEIEDSTSGKTKITEIMSHEETGIVSYNKRTIHFAETLNLSNDLNISQIAEFFGCKTLIGNNFLTETLKCPVSPQDKNSTLANRINAIKALVENPELKLEVETLLANAKKQEEEVITLMSEFFKGKTCPELKSLEALKEQNPYLYPISEFFVKNPTGKIVNNCINTTSLVFSAWGTAHLTKLTYLLAKHNASYRNMALYTGYMGLMTALCSYSLYKDYTTGSEKRTKMHALNQMIVIAEEIEKLCQQYTINTQFKISNIKDGNGIQLIQQLKHARYQSKDMFVFAVPLVHSLLYTLFQQEKHFAEVFACIAELDAYNAIATKIIESTNQKNKFCFVTFLDSQKSEIHATSFWNVLVKDAVPNSIYENKHIILTGPNAGGKTTSIRALLQNIVLAQSFGIAAAETFEMTMLDVIHSYLNISDDISKGLSLFASEVKRAQDITQKIKSLESDKKFFFALDELFTGTVAEDGEACAYMFINKILTLDGIQFIYATHFNKLTELAKETELCTNYKVDAPTKNIDGTLVYPYTLSQGINQSHVALDIAKAASLFE